MEAVPDGASRSEAIASGADAGSFVLFSPDATVTGLYKEALRSLRAAGFVPKAAKWVQLAPGDTDRLYAGNRSSRARTWGDRLVDRLFALDLSLAVVFGHVTLPAREACDALVSLKGPSAPGNVRPGQLRWDLGASNRIMNLLHTSDDPRTSRDEAALFLDREEILHGSGIDEDGQIAGVAMRTDEHGSLFGPLRLLSLKERVVRRCRELPRALVSLLAEERQHFEACRPTVFLPSIDSVLARQRAALVAEGRAARRADAVFLHLGNLPSSEEGAKRLVENVRALGVNVSEWDALTLECEAHLRATDDGGTT